MSRFMAELRRRHVPQTLAIYLVAAWAAIQFADVIVPNLGWEQWVVTATIIAAAIGFPVVLALAWFLEWGPDGVHRTPDAPAEGGEPGTGTPVGPTPSYTPWGVAVGVLAVGIAATMAVLAVTSGGGEGDAESAAADAARTRSERRQDARGAPDAPIPPGLVSPEYAESLRAAIDDSMRQGLEGRGLGEIPDLGSMVEMARRIGEAAGRPDRGGPVEIEEPEMWRFGAPHPVHPGDTLVVRGIARADGGVAAVELEGRVIARARGRQDSLRFEGTWIVPEGRGRRTVRITVRPNDGDPFDRPFEVTLVPRDPAG